jgi:hypothetical protein
MAKKYGFFNMLHDVFFNGNQVSDEFKDKPEKKEGREFWGGLGKDKSSRRVIDREFDPSPEAGTAFRSIFGDDN